MARAIAAGVAAGAVVAACFSTPPRPGTPDDGAVSDVIRLDATDAEGTIDSAEADAMPGCVLETFAQPGTGCGPFWLGVSTGAGATGRNASQQYLYMAGSGTGSAGCRKLAEAISNVTFDVQAALASPAGESTFVGFYASNGSAYGLQLRWDFMGGYVGMGIMCPGTATVSPLPQWDPAAYHFVRVQRAGNGSAEILAGASPATLTTSLGTCAGGTQFNAAEISAVAYRPGSGASGSAQVESVEYCP